MTKEELLKIAKPVLFSTDMVVAILENRKTVTRRLIKPQPDRFFEVHENPFYLHGVEFNKCAIYPQYQIGDTLYVRETFCEVPYEYEHIQIKQGHITIPKIAYKADSKVDYTGIWKPSIHMPKELSRMFLRVKDVRVERAWDITDEQALKEGFDSTTDFIHSIVKTYPKIANENLWLWVIEFERIKVD